MISVRFVVCSSHAIAYSQDVPSECLLVFKYNYLDILKILTYISYVV